MSVGRWLLRRLVGALAMALGTSLFAFLALHVRSEEAVGRLAAASGTPRTAEALAEVRRSYGLDRPVAERAIRWLAGVSRGELGQSWSRRQPVRQVIAEHLPLTLALTGSGLLLQLLLGLAAAALTVRRPDTWQDALVSSTALALHALPEFCVALLLVWPLSIQLHWFPASGAATEPWKGVTLAERLHHLVLPALCLGLSGAAVVARLVRLRWHEQLGADHVTAALARGLSRRRVLWRHGLRGAAGPLCTSIGLSLPSLVGGAVMVEQVFDWPGLGSVMVDAVELRDLPLLAAINLVLAGLVTLGGLLADLAWGAFDPRVRLR